jgi:hypothetical protein
VNWPVSFDGSAYRRLFVLLRRMGEQSRINRINRLYREEGLAWSATMNFLRSSLVSVVGSVIFLDQNLIKIPSP